MAVNEVQPVPAGSFGVPGSLTRNAYQLPDGLDFAEYTLLKDAERRHPVKVHLWKRTQGARLALLPNMNCSDPVWLPFLRDVRLRRALSLAINRREINLALFYGLARESADTVLPESALFRPEFPTAWSASAPA